MGGEGRDTVNYSNNMGAVYVDLIWGQGRESALQSGVIDQWTQGNVTPIVSTDTLTSIENIIGSAFGDRLYGTEFDNVIAPGEGNDIVYALGGIDTVDYSLSAGAIVAFLSQSVVYETAIVTGIVSTLSAISSVDAVYGFEKIIGSMYGDRFYGTDGENYFTVGAGQDIVYGEGGFDTVDYFNAAGGVLVYIGQNAAYETSVNTITTISATSTLVWADNIISVENAVGSAYGDRLYGNAGINVFDGGGGDDILYGGSSNDVLRGDGGNDRLVGEGGFDQLISGAGADRFIMTTTAADEFDSILDFAAGLDDLYVLASAFGLVSGSVANLVIDGPATTANCFIYNSVTGMLSFDSDGAGGVAAVDFVSMGAGLALTSADIVSYG